MLGAALDVLWTSRYDYQAGWRLETHRHNYFQMIHFLSGKGVFDLGRDAITICPGLVVLIRPGEWHGARAFCLVKTLDIKFSVRNPAFRKKLLAAPGRTMAGDSRIAELLSGIRAEGERKGPFYREMCRALMAEVLLLYLRTHPPNGLSAPVGGTGRIPEDTLLRKSLEYIREHYESAIAVSDIARALGCCDRSLRLHFRSALGMRPLDYLQRYRLDRAKELIERSDSPLKEVALKVGFQTVQHFTRRFTAAEGMTPGAWRQRYREGICKDVCINPRFSNPNWTRAE